MEHNDIQQRFFWPFSDQCICEKINHLRSPAERFNLGKHNGIGYKCNKRKVPWPNATTVFLVLSKELSDLKFQRQHPGPEKSQDDISVLCFGANDHMESDEVAFRSWACCFSRSISAASSRARANRFLLMSFANKASWQTWKRDWKRYHDIPHHVTINDMLPLTLAPCSHGALQQGHIVLIQERIMMSWVCPLASQGVGRAMADENPNSPSTGVAQPVVQFLYYIFF